MNSEQVNELYKKYANVEEKSKTETDKVETPAKVDTKAEEVKEEPKAAETIDSDSKISDTAKEETKATPAEDKPKADEKKPTYSQQDKIDFAFQKKQAKIKKLEARNKELEEEIRKMKDLKLEDFKGQVDKYVDYKVDYNSKQQEYNRNKEEAIRFQNEEAERINNEKITRCFPDPAEQQKYNQIVRVEGPKLVAKLDEDDPEQAVLGYLDDSELAPVLIRLLIAEPSYLNEVLTKRSAMGKYRAMEKLEEKVRWAQEKMSQPKEEAPVEKEEEKKPAIPVIGSVTKSEAHKDTKPVFDPNAVLHKLKTKNKYHK